MKGDLLNVEMYFYAGVIFSYRLSITQSSVVENSKLSSLCCVIEQFHPLLKKFNASSFLIGDTVVMWVDSTGGRCGILNGTSIRGQNGHGVNVCASKIDNSGVLFYKRQLTIIVEYEQSISNLIKDIF